MILSFPFPLTDRFAFMMRALGEAVAARIRVPPMTGPMIVHIVTRLRRIAAEFAAVAAKIRAGTYVERAGMKRRAGGAGSRRGVSPVLFHYQMGLPPWAPAWLHRVAPGDAGVWAFALRELLSEPEMAAVIAAVPRMRRILNPLCFMLGVETSLLKPRMPAPAASLPETADGDEKPAAPTSPVVAAHAPPAFARATPVGMIRVPDMPGAKFRPA